MNNKLKKVYKYFLIYGFSRTLIKVAGRKRSILLKLFFPKLFYKLDRNISLIGCGQFGFSTISYFLLKKNGNHFLDCFDVDINNSVSTSKFWGYNCMLDHNDIFLNNNCKYIYIASNHYTHTEYAINALKNDKIVYVEKPVCVNYMQFKEIFTLSRQINKDGNKLYVGYNRPFSKAIFHLNSYISGLLLPITLNCFVIGHFITKDHWYRNTNEGTRICGNVGHWIDLSINIMNTRGLIPKMFSINISYSNVDEIDDNISISMTTEFNDLVNIIISSRSEPFEGINESIQFQSGEVIAKIDDFRKIDIWNNTQKRSFKFFPKDVGHNLAINQPFNNLKRDISEIEISTIIMLEIKDMVIKKEKERIIRPSTIIKNILPNV
jgi:predicted dehydrogenase